MKEIPNFDFPIYLQFYAPEASPPDTLKPSGMSRSGLQILAIISSTGMSYVLLSQTNYTYLTNTSIVEYDISVSSSQFAQRNASFVIYLSFSNFRVTVSADILFARKL